MMAHPVIEQLRQAVNSKHSDALRAISLLAGYLEEPLPANGRKMPKNGPPRKGTGKIRPAVLAAFGRDYLAVEAVAEETGFTTAQVRGVLSAPALKENFLKKEVDRVTHYKYTGKMEE